MRLIDANELYMRVAKIPDLQMNGVTIAKAIGQCKTIEAEPVKLGFWEVVDSSYWRWYPEGARVVERKSYRCSKCGRGSIIKTNYCPDCGAKMDGDTK